MNADGKGPLRGHGLQSEGKPYLWSIEEQDRTGGDGMRRVSGRDGRAVCSCGWASHLLDSDVARKRWHRRHKVEEAAQ